MEHKNGKDFDFLIGKSIIKIEEKELKDSVKECVDFAMEQNDEAKREIFAGLFEEVDRLINETITIQPINDEKKKCFDNEMIKTYEQEIKELQEENKMQDHELERLRNIIKEAKDFIANNSTISGTFGENGKMIVESIEEIHNGMRLFDILDKAGSDK